MGKFYRRCIEMNGLMRIVFPCRTLLPLLLLGLCGGCEEAPTIRQVKTDAVQEAPTSAARTLGAVLPRNTQAWFFKLTGAPEKVAPHADAFQELVKSVKFAGDQDNNPAWELPEGWKQQPASGMRYATLTRGEGKDQVEISVMGLPINGNSVDEYVLTNINRWRDQLKLSPITLDDMKKEAQSIEVDGKNAVLVDLEGAGSGEGMMGGPMSSGAASGSSQLPAGHPPLAATGSASANSGSPPSPPATGQAPPPASPQFEYATPEGWEQGDVRGIRLAAFIARDGDKSVEITVFQMPLAAQDVLSNVNIWRGQIGASEVTAEQLGEFTQPLELAGKSATLVHLLGPEGTSPRPAILAVVASREESVWFFKALGPAELIDREKPKFLEFVKSVRFAEKL